MECHREAGEPPELVGRDREGSVLRVGVPDWEREPGAEASGSEADDIVRAGYTTGLHLPAVAVLLEVDGSIVDTATVGDDPFRFDEPVALKVDAAVRAVIRVVEGPVRIEPTEARDALQVRFEGPTLVQIGFRSRVVEPPDPVTIPETPQGLADALSVVHAPITDRTADRTWPTQRPVTAPVRVGNELSVPEEVAEADAVSVPEADGQSLDSADTVESSVRITAPATPEAVFPLAPLAVYLGARVAVGGSDVRIDAGGDGWEIAPPSERDGADGQRAYERAVQDHLRRAFWLDCLAREAGETADEHRRSGVLEAHGLSAERLYDASIPERLRAYDAVPMTEVREVFPDWHYAISVPACVDAVELLGHRLDQLPLVHICDGEELSEVDVAARALEGTPRGYTPDVSFVEPTPSPARTHAWAGEGVPPGGWKLVDGEPEPSVGSSSDPLEVVVVVNDAAMAEEAVGATDHYGRREADLGIDVRTERGLTPSELARVFESDADLVHFVGHHEEDGLACYGGHLGVEQLGRCNVRTFFLNACGSYGFGYRLIEKGAEGGVVTTDAVGNGIAAGVGRIWSRLMTYGWPVVSALGRARGVALDRFGLEYVVMGEGTTVIAQSDTRLPSVVEIRQSDCSNMRHVARKRDHPTGHGMQITNPVDDEWRLPGEGVAYCLEESEFRNFVERLDSPITVGERFYWPDQWEWSDLYNSHNLIS